MRLRTAATQRFKKVGNSTAVLWKPLLLAEKTFRRQGSWMCTLFLASVLVPGGAAGLEMIPPLAIEAEELVGGLRNLYAPSVLDVDGTKRMWLCGWLTEADPSRFLDSVKQGDDVTKIVGADKIWLAEERSPGSWSWPTRVFEKVGYHVCDPSVIRPPSTSDVDRSRWLYMYYTALDNRYAIDPLQRLRHNVTGLARSIDGGRTWTDLGVILAEPDSGDGYGVWSASALVVGDEIWLYYNSGTPDFTQPINFRQRLSANGWQKLGAAERLQFPERISFNPGFGATLLSNLDVTRQGSQYVMVANTTDAQNIVRFESSNGVVWRGAETDPRILRGGPRYLLAPHQEIVSVERYQVYFGYAEGDLSAAQSIRRSGARFRSLRIDEPRSGLVEPDRAAPDPPANGYGRGVPPASGGSPR